MTNLDETIAQLIQTRPSNWEYRLAAAWLRDGCVDLDRQLADLKRGVIFRSARVLTTPEFSRWAQQKADDIITLANYIATTLADDLAPACGVPEQ